MIATIIELKGDETKGRGDFEFLQLPAAGDQVVVGSEAPGLQIMKVLFVEHSPMRVPPSKADAGRGPMARVYVEHFAYWDVD